MRYVSKLISAMVRVIVGGGKQYFILGRFFWLRFLLSCGEFVKYKYIVIS